MKRKILALSLLMMILLSACGQSAVHVTVPVFSSEEAETAERERQLLREQTQQLEGERQAAEELLAVTDGMAVFALRDFKYIIPAVSTQVILVVVSGTEANVWLLEKGESSWVNLYGPRYARIGEYGVTGEKLFGDRATPLGLMSVGEQISMDGVAARQLLRMDFDLTTGVASTEYNSEVYLSGARDLTQPSKSGSIISGLDDQLELFPLIDDKKSPLLICVNASDIGWQTEEPVPEGFLYLTEAVPGAREEARYATSHNFTGAPLDGYYGQRVIVSTVLAEGLRKVQASLEPQGYGLLVYDAYRPNRASQCMAAWMLAEENNLTKEEFYPNITRAQVGEQGFVVCPSSHSRGVSVDLTLCELETGEEINMGGHFDLFDKSSSFYYNDITDEQYQNRKLLRDAMLAAGFTAYDIEWWHFNISYSTNKGLYFDFAIPQ